MFVDENSEIKFVTSTTQYHACIKPIDCCLYSLCDECYQKKFQTTKRGGPIRQKFEKSPIEKARRTCCHGKEDLVTRSDLWWCTPKEIGTETWFRRAHACFGCEKAFVQVPGGLVPKIPKDLKQFPNKTTYAAAVQKEYAKNARMREDLGNQLKVE